MTSSCGSGDSASEGQCNALVDDAPAITATAVADSAVGPMGGNIADGTYVLSALVLHTGPGGATTVPATTSSIVLEIKSATMQQVGKENGIEKRYTSTISVSGSMLTTTDTCPMTKTETFSFTATDTELRIYQAVPSGTAEEVYSRR